MWSSSNQRIKALISARTREKTRLTRPIHVLRADVTLTIDGGEKIEIAARALLNDFVPDGICLYTKTSLPPNMDMVLELHHPEKFVIQCRVVWCQYQPSASRVITSNSYAYRVGLGFRFADQEQSDHFKAFCERMVTAYAYNGAVAVSNSTSSELPDELTILSQVETPAAESTSADKDTTLDALVDDEIKAA